MNTKIVIDSTIDLKGEIKETLTKVPLTVHFGNEEYIDSVTITHNEFYNKLVTSQDLPTTSQATPSDFEKVFEKEENIVAITLSSTLSGTYQSAVIASDNRNDIYVVDSQSASIGAGILTELAVDLSNKGKSAGEISEILKRERENVCIVAMLDTLEYLKRGGRISKAVAFAGSMLSIKPIIALINGEIKILGKARGQKQGNALIISEIEKMGGIDFSRPFILGYTGQNDSLLKQFISETESVWENVNTPLVISQVGSVIGTHAGPGAVAVAFFKKTK